MTCSYLAPEDVSELDIARDVYDIEMPISSIPVHVFITG